MCFMPSGGVAESGSFLSIQLKSVREALDRAPLGHKGDASLDIADTAGANPGPLGQLILGEARGDPVTAEQSADGWRFQPIHARRLIEAAFARLPDEERCARGNARQSA